MDLITIRILVCGDRNWHDQDMIERDLEKCYKKWNGNIFIINGGCSGADDIARRWAVYKKVDHITMYAHWDEHGRAAGPIRNGQMLLQQPDLVLAYHDNINGSRGTKNMVFQVRKAIAQGQKIKVLVRKHKQE